MSKRLNTIQELRDNVICGGDVEKRGDETKNIRLKKKKGKPRKVSEQKKPKKVPVGDPQKGTRRVKRPMTKVAFNEWLADVEEAVEHFIGMDMDVLPTMPWKRWYKEGLSAVVAAKNAVEMYEDLDDDEDELEEWEDEDEEDIGEEDDDEIEGTEDLEELFGFGKMPYHKWYKKLAAIVERAGLSLATVQSKLGIKNSTLHGWYSAGYAPQKVVELLVKGRKAAKAKVEDIEDGTDEINEGLTQSLGSWASALGLRRNSPSFVETEPPPEPINEEFAEEGNSGDNAVETSASKSDELFGLNINELAEQAGSVLKAKPRDFKRSDPAKVRESPSEILAHEKMLGVDDVTEEDEQTESQEVEDG